MVLSGSLDVQKRELAAYLANVKQETGSCSEWHPFVEVISGVLDAKFELPHIEPRIWSYNSSHQWRSGVWQGHSRNDQRHQVDILLAQQLIIMEFLSIAAVLVIAELFAPGLGFQCPKAMFWFWDSTVDTENVQAAAPFISAAEYKPYGMTFFSKPSKRYLDGCVVVDFFAEAFEYERFLGPILQSINLNYASGVNFVVSGATALNTSLEVPLYLPVQIDQFLRFKQDAYDSRHGMQKLVPYYHHLKTALYVVVISTNNLLNS
ncbi:hypothetical protein SELMODRAFT_432059 [Selaginella moellendorffii]|uniref:Uncharacterized protein n=1 Tax=Selaginella moellendorffii TaxID=88036 RepID=D8TEU9_SELML|nr:hypothetical protein SELMODRAFT_432059 [Selaginella moellendorffii]